MTPANEMELKFDSRSANEGFARVAVAAFMTQLNPTVEEVADVKTAVSEAVTNVIIHGYEKEVRKVYIKCMIEENKELRISRRQCVRCIRPDRIRIGQVWDLRLWRRLWTAWK